MPVEESPLSEKSECSTETTKLDIHDLGKNAYFTECYKYVQNNFESQLDNSQLLGASEKTNFNIYTYTFYFMIEETKMITLTVEFDPLSQVITVTSEPENIDLQEGYYPVKSDKKLTSVRNWLKENNPDLSSSVLVASMAKKFYFGTLYKVVFKVTTKYIIYIAYVECGSKEVKIYDTKETDSFSNSEETTVESSPSEGEMTMPEGPMVGLPKPPSREFGGDSGEISEGEAAESPMADLPTPPNRKFGGDSAEEATRSINFGITGADNAETAGTKAKLKGFARPNASSN